MAEKKYYVYLTYSKMMSTVGSKQMTESEIEGYLKELSECYAEIPQTSCLYSLDAKFDQHSEMNLHLGNQWNNKNNFSEISLGGLYIRMNIKGCSKCHSSKCIKNIEAGKCEDDFVCTVIGKKLFPGEYGKQR